MITRQGLGVLLAVLMTLVAGTFAGAPVALAQTAPSTPPAAPGAPFPAQVCSEDGVSPAPATERESGGQPIVPKPVDGQRPVPVIMVHGWNGDPTTFTQPIGLFADGGSGGDGIKLSFSIVGQLQRIPGLAVYTFDYSRYSNRWVTDGNIGPRLASAIECLTNYYGTKAQIIAHSMGGLATRFALGQSSASGPQVSERVGSVVTFGTPNTGSAVATLAAGALDKSALSSLIEPNLANGAAAAAWIYTSVCGRKMTDDTAAANKFPCKVPDALGGRAIAGFDSDAARAMHVGSAELKALAPWPGGVRVTAVQGSTMLKGISLFGANTSKDGLNAGDVIVAKDSATAGASTSKEESCGYALVARNVVGDTIMGAIKVDMGASQDGWATLGNLIGGANPCFHSNLLRTINGTNAAVNEIKAVAKDAEPVAGVKGTYSDRSLSDPAAAAGSALLPITGTLAADFQPRPAGMTWFHDIPRYFGNSRSAKTLRLKTSDGQAHYFDHGVGISPSCNEDNEMAFNEFSTQKEAYSKAYITLYFKPDTPPGMRVRLRVLAGNSSSLWISGGATEIYNALYTTGDPLPSIVVDVAGYSVIGIAPTFDDCAMGAGSGPILVDSGFAK